MLEELCGEFERRFGRGPEAGGRAPGRVNLIGEHTDYTGGLVLPCAIDRATVSVAARRDDARARVWSREGGAVVGEGGAVVELDLRALAPQGGWSDYVVAVVRALGEAGSPPGGFDLAVAGDVPLGSGLSSSAALLVSLATTLDALFGWGLSREARARIAHRAENGFVGVACGIMDPFASALCRAGHALRLDCRSGQRRDVPFPAERAALLLADSGVERKLAEAAYNARVAECGEALDAARRLGFAADTLRDLTPEQLPALERGLEATPLRRARHVVSENARVDAMCVALASGDVARAGALLKQGMRSLRDDYEVSTPELDQLCEAADALPGVHGSRLTGAGFGGCTVHLVDPDAAAEASDALATAFEARFGRRPRVWRVAPAAGCEVLPLPGR